MARSISIYVDDSGKFKTESDGHVFYSFLVFNKDMRRKYNEIYYTSVLPLSRKKNFPEPTFSYKELINQHKNFENIKGHEFIKKYSKYKAIKKRGGFDKVSNFENILELYSTETLFFGTICWCKNKSTELFGNDSLINENIKKNFMILKILDLLSEKEVICSDDAIRIYLDEEESVKDSKKNYKREDLLSFLNFEPELGFENLTAHSQSWLFLRSSEDINDPINYFKDEFKNLRKNKIFIKEIQFLPSSFSFPIQGADLMANLANKILNQGKNMLEFLSFFLENKTKITTILLPERLEIDLCEEHSCCIKK